MDKTIVNTCKKVNRHIDRNKIWK